MTLHLMRDGHTWIFSPSFYAMKVLTRGIDYFIKWIEVELITKILEARMNNFIWKSIICRFGLLRVLITGNGHQFSSFRLAKHCWDLGVTHCFTSVAILKQMGRLKLLIELFSKG